MCVLPCPRAITGDVSCGYTYVPSGEVLGHRGDVAKLNVGSSTDARWSLGKSQRSLWLVSRPPSK